MNSTVTDDFVAIAFAQGQKPILLPCPFCGKEEGLGVTQLRVNYFVECVNKDCRTQPMTMGNSVDQVVDRWNTRETEAMAQEAYTLRWLREEAKEGGWDLLDLVELARDRRLVKKVRRPARYNDDGF